ncbi:MAG: substrate-binding periplasmic protein [Acidimicrobiales bacterium]
MKLSYAGTAAALVVAGLLTAGCGSNAATPTSAATNSAPCSNANLQSYLYQRGQLTVATDSPAYWPWFYRNNPSDGRGYESAVAYAIAAKLGFSRPQVKWVVEPFSASYQPGPKHFDFDINEISVTAARAQEVTFSVSYYDVTQGLVALSSSAMVKRHTAAELKTYIYGDQIGTTSLQFINDDIQPNTRPSVFDTLNEVQSALEAHSIQAFVTDTPTAQYMASSEIPHGVLIGQFPSSDEHYGLLFAKGDKLAECVDGAINSLTKSGTLGQLQKHYLRLYNKVPSIKP